MKKHFFSLTLILLIGGHLVFSQGSLDRAISPIPTADQFRISPGVSFSASGSGTGKRSASPSPASAVVSDLEEALAVIREQYVDRAKAKSTATVDSAIRSMLHSLDPHSSYFDEQEFAELLGEHKSEYSGTGSTIMNFRRNGQVETYIVAVSPESSAAEAGIGFGDRIISVDGKDVSGISSLAVREMVRGPRGTRVSMKIEQAATGKIRTVSILRERVAQPTVPRAFMLDDKTGYIDMTVGFSYTTVTEFDESLAKLSDKGMGALILDLRGNRGGILDQAVAVAERFLPYGRVIVTQRGRNAYEDREWRSQTREPATIPIVLLVDSETASAAEIIAGAFQDNDRAMIVGTPTFGKGLVQSVLELENSSGLALTSARYYTPSGRSIQRDYSDGSLYDYFARTHRAAAIDRAAMATRTLSHRKVYGGNGIEPDIEFSADGISPEKAAMVDPIFHFAKDLLGAKFPGSPSREEFRRAIMFGEETVTDEVISAFTAHSKVDVGSDRDFIRTQLRYFIALGAFGTNAADEAKIKDDKIVYRGVQAVDAARELAGTSFRMK